MISQKITYNSQTTCVHPSYDLYFIKKINIFIYILLKKKSRNDIKVSSAQVTEIFSLLVKGNHVLEVPQMRSQIGCLG